VGKRLDLFELCFAKCKRHWFSSWSLSAITEIDQCVCGKKFLPVRGAQDENALNKKLTVLVGLAQQAVERSLLGGHVLKHAQ
jgi:hypothetical protein